MTAQSIKKGICDALSNVDAAGSFTCSGVLDFCSNPALSIQGLGTIGLPLSDRDAKAIVQAPATQQSPFGKGSETLVDTNVRKSWQIDPKDFQMRNPHFRFQIDHVIAKAVAKNLGVACGPGNVTAQLYKLLLYEEGAFFLPHQDGEKVDGMFGTLMVCLPSEHTGGEVHLSHEGRHEIVKTSETSGFDYSYAAWYADVTHEVKPIMSGNRLVLIYNLVQKSSGPIPTASACTDSKSRLKQVLATWNSTCSREDPDIPRMLAYKLAYKYSKASLSFDSLKGSDHIKFRHLSDACLGEDVVLYLARIKKEVDGGCEEDDYGVGGWGWRRYGRDRDGDTDEDEDEDGEKDRRRISRTSRNYDEGLGGCHKIIEIYDSSIKLTQVIDQNRSTVAENMDFEVEYIAQGDIFKRAPDDEDYSGYTGNEGVSTTHFYHDTVALLIPRMYLMDFRYKSTQSSDDILQWLKSLQDDFVTSSDESNRLELEKLCDLIMESNKKNRSSEFRYSSGIYDDEMVTTVATAALKLDDVCLLEEALPMYGNEPPSEIFNIIRDAVPRLGFKMLKPALDTCMKGMRHIHSKWSALVQIVDEPARRSNPEAKCTSSIPEHWTRTQAESMLSSYPWVSAKDGATLVDVSDRFGSEFLTQRISPYVKSLADKTQFAMAFLTRLFELRENCQIPASTILDVYSGIVGGIIKHLDLGNTQQAVTDHRYPRLYTNFEGPDSANKRSQMVTGSDLMQILQQCEVLCLDGHISSLFTRILDSALKQPEDIFDRLLLPYLTLLLSHLQKEASVGNLGNDCFEHFHLVLRAYIIRKAGREPRKPPNFRFPTNTVNCPCKDCKELKDFISDGGRATCDFKMSQTRRKHLEKQIYSPDFQCNTIASGSPYILVVRKVHGRYLQAHTQWQRRLESVKKAIRELDRNPWLKRILGDKHDEINNVEITDQPLPTLGMSLSRTETLATDLSSGNKRKESEDGESRQVDQRKRARTGVVDLVSD